MTTDAQPYDYAREIDDARNHYERDFDTSDEHLTAADFAEEEPTEGEERCENCGEPTEEGEKHTCPPPCLATGTRVNVIRAQLAPGMADQLPEHIFWNPGTVEEADPEGACVRWRPSTSADRYEGSFYFQRFALEVLP